MRRAIRIICVLCAPVMLAGLLMGCGVPDAAYVVTQTEGAAGRIETVEFPEAAESAGAESGAQKASREQIYVYVCGAVATPGVYALPADSRADDALQAAGGFSEDAQTDYVNLAAKVSDGEKLYIPTRQEAEALSLGESAVSQGLVNINTADVPLLCTLPGIGESRAQDIVAYREKNGAFQSIEDIMKVSGIKTSIYEKLCDKITIN